MKAFLKNYRQSPRKVRLVADLVKGKKVVAAVAELERLPKRASLPIKKLILSAVANAEEGGAEKENLFIKDLRVDKGEVLKRMFPKAMGRGSIINRRASHVSILLGENVPLPSEKKQARKTVKKPEQQKAKEEKRAKKPEKKKITEEIKK